MSYCACKPCVTSAVNGNPNILEIRNRFEMVTVLINILIQQNAALHIHDDGRFDLYILNKHVNYAQTWGQTMCNLACKLGANFAV